jgi:hypothetical protein
MILTMMCIRFFGSYYGFRTFATSTRQKFFNNHNSGKIRPRRTDESSVLHSLLASVDTTGAQCRANQISKKLNYLG